MMRVELNEIYEMEGSHLRILNPTIFLLAGKIVLCTHLGFMSVKIRLLDPV